MKKFQAEIDLIKESGLFDTNYYLKEYPDVARSGMDPIKHYLVYGATLLRRPSEKFDTKFYLESNPDLVSAKIKNPLLHYIQFSVKEERIPCSVEVVALPRHSSKPESPTISLLDNQSNYSIESKELSNSGKVAVVVHYFYPEIWAIISTKLKSLSNRFDLFITAPLSVANLAISDVSKDFPSARFQFGPNVGMDIIPFLSIVPTLINEKYIAVCKLQTKRGDGHLAEIWRDIMLDSLIGSSENFSLAVRTFEEDQDVCLIGPAALYQSGPKLMYENLPNLTEILDKAYSREMPDSDWGFFAGTMFWARTEILVPLSRLANFSLDNLDSEYKKDGKVEHALERFFGLLARVHSGKVGLLQQRSAQKNDCGLLLTDSFHSIGQAHIGDVMRQYARLEADVKTIEESGLFDKEFYIAQAPELAGLDMNLAVHYLTQGTYCGLSPNFNFKIKQEILKFQRGRGEALEPFVFYIENGANEASIRSFIEKLSCKKPVIFDQNIIEESGLFDREYYIQQCPELKGLDVDLVKHYLMEGTINEVYPNKYFIPREYRALHADIVKAGVEPFFHYITKGAIEGRRYRQTLRREQEETPFFRFVVLNSTLINWRLLDGCARDKDLVSIVIPIYGQPELTRDCIESILVNYVNTKYEIVCVDNGSDENTLNTLKHLQSLDSRIKLALNPENYNFALGCNLGFAKSSGSIVVFLNNDTTVTPGWLDALVAPLEDVNIAAVQPKLVYPDGTIQCSGIVFSDRSTLGYPLYAGVAENMPCVNKSRKVQAITAACMAIRAHDFIALKGFDPTFINGQDDVDLCLRLKRLSKSGCWYEADSLVYHHESKTPGRGKYIPLNRRIFVDRWRGKVAVDDYKYYAADNFQIIDWKIDNEDFAKQGIGISRPVVVPQKKKIAVVVHVYYPELWSEIASRLKAITHQFDLFVTTTYENAALVQAAVIADFPSARIKNLPNRGMDIVPFLSLVPTLVNEGYLAVCKVHTKKGFDDSAAVWRDVMLDSLLGSEHNFSICVEAFDKEERLSIVGPAILYQSGPRLMYENGDNLSRIVQAAYGKNVPQGDWGFFAGTMFWVRPQLLQSLAHFTTHQLDNDEFVYKKDGRIEHALERFFGLLPVLHGGLVGLLNDMGYGETKCDLLITESSEAIGSADIGAVLRHRSSVKRDAEIIRATGLFDENIYKFQYPKEFLGKADPLYHYLLQGCFKGKRPNKSFSPTQYWSINKDVQEHRVEPFSHYIKTGAMEGRQIFKDGNKEPLFRYHVLNRAIIDWDKLASTEANRNIDVSIVIPVYGQGELTIDCLNSIYSFNYSSAIEVIIVDNGSDVETANKISTLDQLYPSVRLIKNKENFNFSLGCNLGFSYSRGKVVVFLNNDTTVTKGWLENLIAPLENQQVVAVQPKLLFPDGTLQCGGVVFSKWSCLGYPIYSGFPASDPCVNKSRPFQAITAACIAIRALDFANAKGFDVSFINGQEDVDLCLRLVDGGGKYCWYAADSLVIHHEGKSEGRGRYIPHNRREFVSRWSGKYIPDDFQYYDSDGFAVEEWQFDSEQHLQNGVAVYRPRLVRNQDKKLIQNDIAFPFKVWDSEKGDTLPNRDMFVYGLQSTREGWPTILICAHAAGKELFGGERSFLDILEAVNQCNFNIIVTFPDVVNMEYFYECKKYVHGIYIFDYNHWQKENQISKIAIARFSSIIKRHNIKFVHVNTIVIREPLIAARVENIPCAVHARELIMHDETLSNAIGLAPSEIVQSIYENSDFVIANSITTAKEFGHFEKTFVAPNVAQIDILDIENVIDRENIKFALISSNLPKKGIYDVIEVANLCKQTAPNARFLIIGPDQPEIKELCRLQESGSVPSNVSFIGYQKSPLDALMHSNVVFNLSSFAESFGRTVAEAMAARRPVIAYDWGALAELVVPNKTGFLVPFRDVRSVADKVRLLCENPELIGTYGDNGREYVVRKHAPSTLKRSLDSIYTNILIDKILFKGNRHFDEYSMKVVRIVKDKYCLSGEALFKNVTVVIPVYNAIEEVLVCINSVIEYTDFSNTKLLIIDDCSPDESVSISLEQFRVVPGVTILRNDTNLGYTRTINRAINLVGDDDVVLLNSDTIVSQNWLFGLRMAAYAIEKVGTVTAMSDNAGVFSFPVPGQQNPRPSFISSSEYAAAILEGCLDVPLIELPTGNGFCMYIRRRLIDEIGFFDYDAFPRGYGEENDFCLRSLNNGYINLLTPWSFVFHIRTASFKGEKNKLVEEGLSVLRQRYPDYDIVVKKAFSSPEFMRLVEASRRAFDGLNLTSPSDTNILAECTSILRAG